jgi:mono/diheme cytochrome c family protein
MDFPVFHLDFLNNRFLIALIAVLHVIINHPMAVGGIPLVTLLEWRGQKCENAEDKAAWDKLAYRILFVFFLITTTIGAMTGVGIWFSTSLVNPYAIGSLIRVFFWAWFTEWVVFVTEVVCILAYFLTWKKWLSHKTKHIQLGLFLSIASWLTMAIIVAILAFMMDPGNWQTDRSLLSGFLNPLYLPQLSFRTPLAMLMGGTLGLALIPFFTKDAPKLKSQAMGFVSHWILAWVPALGLGGFWYYKAVPETMRSQIAVANLTQEFSAWQNQFIWILGASMVIAVGIALIFAMKPTAKLRPITVVPFVLFVALISHFERVREFIRKPYAIGNYLYSNGFRVDDYPLLQRDGILKHATYANVREITPENTLQAGKDVFTLACTRCHTTQGINGIKQILTRMYGTGPWDEEQIKRYVATMHNTRSFMPPFPGSETELDALSKYLAYLSTHTDVIPGSQVTGTKLPILTETP